MHKNLEFTADANDTLLPFLLARLGKSRNSVKGVLRRGQVYVDGRRVTDYACPLRAGQRITVLANAPEARKKPELPVVFENGELIAIDKPAGLLPVATDRQRENTAYRMVTDYLKSGDVSSRVFIVHRLDRDTSGVMLFAKNERLKLALQDGWDELVSLREYIAVAEGYVSPPEGQIRSWLKQTKTLLVYSSRTEGDGKLAAPKKALTDTHCSVSRSKQGAKTRFAFTCRIWVIPSPAIKSTEQKRIRSAGCAFTRPRLSCDTRLRVKRCGLRRRLLPRLRGWFNSGAAVRYTHLLCRW